MISFGPIPSRRLGKSLGINNLTSPKTCSYACLYCQVGLTHRLRSERCVFYEPSVIFDEVQRHLDKLKPEDKPDYLTFVSNGEPTLDVNLGITIEKLKVFNIPIAVITNASLLNNDQVRNDLMQASWVSVKVDAGVESVWKRINRSIDTIQFSDYVDGLHAFSSTFNGTLATETMLVAGFNDSIMHIRSTVDLISTIQPAIAYLSVPTRPPAVRTALSPSERVILEAHQLFLEKGITTELILGFEGTNAGFTGNALEDIINICSVHPIREDTMQELLRKNNADSTLLETLVHSNYIEKIDYKFKSFYIRKFRM